MTDGYDDDALRARLRASDPARTLSPADTDRVARLLRETMHTDEQTPAAEPTPVTDLGPTTTREAGARGRNPLTWVVAAAAVVLIAGAALFGVLRHDDTTVPSAAPSGASRQTTTELSAPRPEAYRARCMVPSAATLSQQTLAFDGTVRSIAGGLVTLTPTHFYAGDPTDLVTVRAPSSQLPALVSAVRLEQGGRYLVSASHGTVSVCGLSAPWSADLAGLYHRAFEGR